MPSEKRLVHSIVWTWAAYTHEQTVKRIQQKQATSLAWKAWSPLPMFALRSAKDAAEMTAVLQAPAKLLSWEASEKGAKSDKHAAALEEIKKALCLAGVKPEEALFIYQYGCSDHTDAVLQSFHSVTTSPLTSSHGRATGTPDIILYGIGRPSEDSESVDNELNAMEFTSAYSLPPECDILNESTQLYKALELHRPIAKKNIEDGKIRFLKVTGHRVPWNHEKYEKHRDEFDNIFEDGDVFDHRSGAISFDPYDWVCKLGEERNKEPWDRIISYFEKRYEEPWREDRPNYRRALATPTKFLLRGEDYYTNMRNESPLLRLRDIARNTDKALKFCNSDILGHRNKNEWKLCLGLLDQLRNSALQFAWFSDQITSKQEFASYRNESSEKLSRNCFRFLDNSTFLYYAVLTGKDESNPCDKAIKQLLEIWPDLKGQLTHVVRHIAKDVKADLKQPQNVGSIKVTRVATRKLSELVRRWREADHPGENLLVALHAHEYNADEATAAVGIGWGGIELPIVYRQVAQIMELPHIPKAYLVNYGKYSKSARRQKREVFPFDDRSAALAVKSVILFDDNILSGQTIQEVAVHLWKEHEITTKVVFVTRLSGERRYGQMRMPESGVIDPNSIGNMVLGHLGETPFSRAWSSKAKQYKNAIGVFSIAKRRILDLLHSNSSADRFDREE